MTTAPPSDWVQRFVPWATNDPSALDLACGSGRHTQLLLDRGHRVTAVDIELNASVHLGAHPKLERLAADLESPPWPLTNRRFDLVVVTNYLWRPTWDQLVSTLNPGGRLIYETFAQGHEALGRPRRKEFLLARGELLERVASHFDVVAYEDGRLEAPARVVQRICAIRRPTANAAPSLTPGSDGPSPPGASHA